MNEKNKSIEQLRVIENSMNLKGVVVKKPLPSVNEFKDLAEVNQKESPRLQWGSKILNKMGIKTILTSDSITIFGNPNLKIKKKIIIKNFLKDHRVFMTSVIAAYSFGGNWKIYDKDSIKTSFPNFLKIINKLKK